MQYAVQLYIAALSLFQRREAEKDENKKVLPPAYNIGTDADLYLSVYDNNS